MFETVLVANRGEIACRVISTLRRLGIRSVAVYSDPDIDARHVREADVAVRLGPAAAAASYLNVAALLEAAARTGAQAVHPGYGFLAENASFARACAAAGLVFVGPPPEAVEVMGDKIRAKQAVIAAGVPVVPGTATPGMTDADLVAAAHEVGFPVLVKPSAGGGGKGMRLVERAADLAEALVSARREASSSFGDDTLFLERFVQRPRHIEVQVMADAHGSTLHLGERECSLQRRHQKVVEEAPSSFLTPEQRERYGALAVATAEAVGYTGAGTVELIVASDAPDEPFFMEMNTRLQVEHPVTELVTGLDLVELQLRVAAGEQLPLKQSDVVLTGHAVEARIYAEDPAAGFLPTGGHALLVREPSGPGVRVDSSLVEGTAIGTTYDPMLSKVIAWGPDRATALDRLDRALAGTVVLGCTTGIGFVRQLLALPEVRAGQLDTGLLERSLDGMALGEVPHLAYAAFALERLSRLTGADPWDSLPGFRLGAPPVLRWRVRGRGRDIEVLLQQGRVQVDGDEHEASAITDHGRMLVTLDGITTDVLVAVNGDTTWLASEQGQWSVTLAPPLRTRGAEAAAEAEVRSPMPGAVVALMVASGDAVSAGDPLLAVEAMKMEHVLRAAVDGVVEMLVRKGDQVVVGQVLARVEARLEPAPS